MIHLEDQEVQILEIHQEEVQEVHLRQEEDKNIIFLIIFLIRLILNSLW